MSQGRAILSRKGILISTNTIQRRLQAKAVTYRSTNLKPLFSEKHVEKRLKLAHDNIDIDWSNVVFSDEASFWGWIPKKHAWSSVESRMLQRTVKHPVKLHVWGCFCKQGFGCLHVFTENLNAQKIVKIYQKGFLRSTKQWFGDDNDSWILQEDNDPKHCSLLCKHWKEENGIQTMDWPPSPPDANPSENVWGVLKAKLQEKCLYNLAQLSRHVRKLWRDLSSTYAETLVDSMPKRCPAIIDNTSDWTIY